MLACGGPHLAQAPVPALVCRCLRRALHCCRCCCCHRLFPCIQAQVQLYLQVLCASQQLCFPTGVDCRL